MVMMLVRNLNSGGAPLGARGTRVEAAVGEVAGPVLADERGAEEACGVFGRHTKEDLLNDLVQ
jgi:hypothetical protein